MRDRNLKVGDYMRRTGGSLEPTYTAGCIYRVVELDTDGDPLMRTNMGTIGAGFRYNFEVVNLTPEELTIAILQGNVRV